MNLTLEQAKKMMDKNKGNLDLRRTSITTLPDNLTVSDGLYLANCIRLTSLPKGLTVGGCLDLYGCANLISLPEGLKVGDWLDLYGCISLTSLPVGLVAGGWLDLRGTDIAEMPEGVKVGKWLLFDDETMFNPPYERLKNGDYVPNQYLYADNILTHVKKTKKVGDYTLYIGKIPGKNVVSDGEFYAHCKNLREGIADIVFKRAKNRGAEQYKNLTLDSSLPLKEAITMYRIITGACRQGTQSFLDSQKTLKDRYTIQEIIDATQNQYGGQQFKKFFEK